MVIRVFKATVLPYKYSRRNRFGDPGRKGHQALDKIMKLAMIVAVALVMSVASFAAPTSCASPTPLSTFTPPPDPDEGCLVVNNTFVSFDVPQASAGQFTLTDPTTIVGFTLTANTVSTPTPTQIFVRESPTDQGSIQFTSPGPATGTTPR